MFPGQGSQKKGMGEGLFEQFPEVTAAADAILGYSVRELCLQDAGQRLGQTQFTQPALYTVNALTCLQQGRTGGAAPDYVAGHSLGEYNALLTAGVFDFATGLKLVQKRGALMAQAQGGGMAAVVGMGFDEVRGVIDRQGLGQIDLANINAPNQIVISGPRAEIQRAQAIFEAAGAMMYVPLNVSGAFHSRYMADFQSQFRSYLAGFAFAPPRVPVISNVEGRPYAPDQAARLLADQMTHSVRWSESILYLRRQGVEDFREIGPGKVLTGLVNKIRL
jgi:trans-AT polyketide synthase/acyltransferase/oxidoreductase domain-containing protein